MCWSQRHLPKHGFLFHSGKKMPNGNKLKPKKNRITSNSLLLIRHYLIYQHFPTTQGFRNYQEISFTFKISEQHCTFSNNWYALLVSKNIREGAVHSCSAKTLFPKHDRGNVHKNMAKGFTIRKEQIHIPSITVVRELR